MARADFLPYPEDYRVPGTGTITVTPEYLEARFPYDPRLVEELKETFPGRRWDPERKLWLLPARYLAEAESWMRRRLDQVEVTEPVADPLDWVAMTFANISPENRLTLYRGLRKVFHPEMGGDVATMRRICEEYRDPGR